MLARLRAGDLDSFAVKFAARADLASASATKGWSARAPVRAHYVQRFGVVGANPRATTLARSLAAAYATHWVPEYGRDYTVEKFTIGTGDRWLPSDFLRIALEQDALEDRMAREAPVGILFFDTDSFATALWEEVYLGSTSDAVLRAVEAHGSPYALYVLADHLGIPWEDDGLRLGAITLLPMRGQR